MDNATAVCEKLAYAKCFIEISASILLPSTITLDLEGGDRIDIPVDYEWTPLLCKKSVNFGHTEAQCPTTRVWRQKEPTTHQ